jgi:large subunit GTPase 1
VLGNTKSAAEKSKLDSIVERSDLEEFLDTALMSQKNFAASRGDVVVVGNIGDPLLVSNPEVDKDRVVGELYEYENVSIPRRPYWDEDTTPEALEQSEREMFLGWRRDLAEMEEKSNLVMTPFEKNLDIWRQLWRVIERSDIVVQIVDARNPLLFRCKDLEDYVKEVDSSKRLLLLINKSDLLSAHMRENWAEYFASQNIEFAFCSAIEDQVRQKEELLQDESTSAADASSELEEAEAYTESEEEEEDDEEDKSNSEEIGSSEKYEEEENQQKPVETPYVSDETLLTDRVRVFSTSELLRLFRLLHFNGDSSKMENSLDESITVGMVGYPNVGKSSMINALCGEKKVGVAAMPGKTRHFQTIKLGNVLLCDCPGLVFPTFMNTKAALLCNGILPIDRMRDHVAPVHWICNRISAEQFESTYNLKLPELTESVDQLSLISHSAGRCANADDLLSTYARQRGFMASSGRPDDSRAARIILKDFTKGKLLYCHPPPHLDENLRLEFFNSLEKTSVIFKLDVDPESLSKRFEIEAKGDSVLKDMMREK